MGVQAARPASAHQLVESGPETPYVDAINASEDWLRQLLTSTTPLRFDWENKWLRGDQYAHMLNNIDGYVKAFGMRKMGEKQHPENIYLQPESKCLCADLLLGVGPNLAA